MCIASNYLSEMELEIKNVQLIVNKYKKEKQDMYNRLSECDLKLTDLDHALEFRKELKLSAVDLTKIAIEISNINIERREIKNELDRLEKLTSIMDKINAIRTEETEKNIKVIKSKQSNLKYTPRTNVLHSLGKSFN